MEIFSDDIQFNVGSFLEPNDLGRLALTSKTNWSIVEEVARRIVSSSTTQTEQEQTYLSSFDGESWVKRYHELNLFRTPLEFDQLIGSIIQHVNNNTAQVRFDDEFGEESCCTVIFK